MTLKGEWISRDVFDWCHFEYGPAHWACGKSDDLVYKTWTRTEWENRFPRIVGEVPHKKCPRCLDALGPKEAVEELCEEER